MEGFTEPVATSITFCDSIVEEAAVKVTKNTFSIEFKAAYPESWIKS